MHHEAVDRGGSAVLVGAAGSVGTVSGNTMTATSGSGVRVYEGNSTVGAVDGNSISGCAIGVHVHDGGRVTNLTGNQISGATIEIFKADPDPTGYGEGKTYLKSVTASSGGEVVFHVNLSDLPITATATDAAGNTSEFCYNDLKPVADAGGEKLAERTTLAGTPVRHLIADSEVPAGLNTAAWNATGDNGLKMPAGTYLIEVAARRPEGAAGRSTAPLRLNR